MPLSVAPSRLLPVAPGVTPIGFLRERKVALAVAVSIMGVVLIKEIAFGLAIGWLILLRPLSAREIKSVLVRLWPLLLMLAIAVFMTMVDVSGTFDQRATLRILFYYVRIPVFLILGFGARRYMRNSTVLLWMLLLLGIYTSSETLFTYLTSAVGGLDREHLRQIVGGGSPISPFVPIIARILWTRRTLIWQRGILLMGMTVSLLSIAADQSRTGFVVVALSFALNLPRLRPLRWARWAVLGVLLTSFMVTTPVFPAILQMLSIDPTHLGGLQEVIARPRYDMGLINTQWRGHETYMAFVAAGNDGLLPLILGHGLSASADLGIYIELAPGQFFSSVDIFHNGYSFIVLHSGLLGVLLYMSQLFLLARPQAALRSAKDAHVVSDNDEDLLYVVVLLSLAASTSVIAGMFNASTFATLHLFLLGCFYPLRTTAVRATHAVVALPADRIRRPVGA